MVCARWETKTTADSYGRGPGWKCLGDVKMLQKMQKAKLVALDKNTNPPVMVSASVQGEVNLLPGGITRCNSLTDAAIKPAYQVQPDLQSLDQAIEQVRQTIRAHFFADVFVMLSSQEPSTMTAAEVAERRQEKMLLLGPIFQRLKTELLDPLIERVFDILQRQGLLPPIPDYLQGIKLNVQYISTIAQAQRASMLEPLAQGIEWIKQLLNLNPALAGQINYQQALAQGLESLGVQNALLSTPIEELEHEPKQMEGEKHKRFTKRAKNVARPPCVMAHFTSGPSTTTWFCSGGCICYGISLRATQYRALFT